MSKKIKSQKSLRRYFLPGLKKWITIAILGVVFLFLGIALYFELRPISRVHDFIREATHEVARILPNTASAYLAIAVGLILIVYSFLRANKVMVKAMVPDFADDSVLDALDKVHSLNRGIKIVAIGGGTGLSSLLSGLKYYTSNITAIVTVADDGGSSGRLREELGIIPPGDIRNCIAALADEDKAITELFQYRFKGGQNLEGHSFGNLFLSALIQISGGDFVKAAKTASSILRSSGTVLPASPEPMKIRAVLEDGTVIEGESNIPSAKCRIKQIQCEPERPKALKEAIQAIINADLIILGPGSLYTSIIPNLLVPDIRDAIKQSNAHKIYICNIMTQPGETTGYAVSDHIEAIIEHSGNPHIVEGVIVNDRLPEKLLEKYKEKKQEPVKIDSDIVEKYKVRIIARSLIKEESLVRHDPTLLAKAIVLWARRWQKYPVKREEVITPF